MPEKSITNRGELLHPSFVHRGEATEATQHITGSSSSLYNEDPEIIDRGDGAPVLSGLTVFTASVFVIGEMAGSGVVALPSAMVNAGVIGFVMLVLGCLASGYCGVVLARSWTILRARHPEYQQHVREPYPAIGRKAVGKWGAIAVNISINITLLGKSSPESDKLICNMYKSYILLFQIIIKSLRICLEITSLTRVFSKIRRLDFIL